jgi:hypothetical protein
VDSGLELLALGALGPEAERHGALEEWWCRVVETGTVSKMDVSSRLYSHRR